MRKKLTVLGVFVFSLVAMSPAMPTRESQSRNFILFFEVLEYRKELDNAVSFFFNQVLRPGDQLIVYTPVRAYSFSRETLTRPKKDLIQKVQGQLRGDTAVGGANYKIIMDDMLKQSREIENALDQNSLRRALTAYRQNLNNLRSLRIVSDTLLADVIEIFKDQPGENHVVMTYQAEFRPIPDRETLNNLRAMPIISFEANELFFETETKPPVQADLFIELFRESGILLHFFYIKSKDVFTAQNSREQSVDMFNVFNRIAAATGGIVETTSAPEAAFKTLLKFLNSPPSTGPETGSSPAEKDASAADRSEFKRGE